MSTAGKVLIVLVMLMIVVWIVLSRGRVADRTRTANTKLNELTKKVEELQSKVERRQEEVASLLIQIRAWPKKRSTANRSCCVPSSRISNEPGRRSPTTLAGVKYELEIVEGTVKAAQTDLEHRNTEHEEETKVLEKDRADVQELMAAMQQAARSTGVDCARNSSPSITPTSRCSVRPRARPPPSPGREHELSSAEGMHSFPAADSRRPRPAQMAMFPPSQGRVVGRHRGQPELRDRPRPAAGGPTGARAFRDRALHASRVDDGGSDETRTTGRGRSGLPVPGRRRR